MAFPLHPEVPREGMSLEELFKGSNYDIKEAQARIAEVAKAEGLPISDNHTMTYNSKRAQMLGLWATSLGKGDEFHNAAFRTVFVDNKNIALDDVLLELVEGVGLDRAEAEGVLRDESFMVQVDADWELSRKRGVSAVPTCIYGGRSIVGAQPYEALKQLVQEPGKGPNPFNMLRSG